MDMKNLTVADFSRLAASDAITPGGGSVTAAAGAFAASLVCMTAKATKNKKGYEEVRARMTEIDAQGEDLRRELLDLIQEDCNAFDAYLRAFRLPKSNNEEKDARADAVQDALKAACAVPMRIAACSSLVLALALEAVSKCNTNALSDAFVGALLARSAVLGAVSSVRVNLGSIKDEAFVLSMIDECGKLEQAALETEKQAILARKARA